jgi:hypothetical protein
MLQNLQLISSNKSSRVFLFGYLLNKIDWAHPNIYIYIYIYFAFYLAFLLHFYFTAAFMGKKLWHFLLVNKMLMSGDLSEAATWNQAARYLILCEMEILLIFLYENWLHCSEYEVWLFYVCVCVCVCVCVYESG